ncbi:non-ribosomal peptide synthetase [Pseudoalteromonas rubra]|uniref:Carrier domain-containing protein n=1 Tax=Pseudoalteromonas rubra TaxID=43658 RepID=A0A0F4QJ81_9GAMM|nr:non-ribosomal peptide synthetase [Pseudoalteromonas rubra]KJZ06717.1 hypothetical protein TW77_18090 [Pseudoalteromonas rubra]
MNINGLLELCADSGIFLYTENGELNFEMTSEVFPEELKNKVIENKSAIIEFLSDKASYEKEENTIASAYLNEQGEHPLAYSQQRLWLIDRISGSSEQYNSPSVTRIKGQFDLVVAEQAINAIIERHLPLRAVFSETEEGVHQTFQKEVSFKIQTVDLSKLSPLEQANELSSQVESETLKPFNLGQDLLIRAVWFQVASDEGLLVFNIHHIAADAWSVPILNREFIQFYSEIKEAGMLIAPKLEINYLDFIYWQQKQVSNGQFDSQLQYWQKQLNALPLEHSLKFDSERPPQTTFCGGSVSFSLDALQSELFCRVAHEHNVSHFMLAHALFSLFISIKGESDDIVVGTPVANRYQQGVNDLIGFFTNTLVLRVSTEKNIPFSQWLSEIKHINLDAQSNQDLPFDVLVDELNPVRSPNYSPLFQIMLTSNSTEENEANLPDLIFSPESLDNKTSKFDLLLDFRESQGSISFNFEYNSTLFDASTIACYAEQFKLLCNKVLENTDSPIHAFDLLCDGDKSFLIDDMNNVKKNHDGQKLIHQYFEDFAEKAPHRLALQYLENKYSYQEINHRANKLAHFLKSKGAAPDKIVGLLLDRRVDTVVSILAVLKTGAAYTPLDVNLPSERIAYMIEDSSASLVISASKFTAHAYLNNVDLVILDNVDCAREISLCSCQNIEPTQPLDIHSPVVMIYTSGSTGRPKGVTESHIAITNLVLGQFQGSEAGSIPRTMMFAPFSFDASVHEMVTTWLDGGALVLAGQQVKDNLIELPEFMASNDINRAFIPPSVINLVFDIAYDKGVDLSAFKFAVVAGEVLKIGNSTRRFLIEHPDFELWNHYGPSETHVLTEYRVKNQDNEEMPPIGKMIPNMNGYILDRHGRLVPFGEPGILFVSGPAVGPGYHMNPEITRQRYIDNPFKTEDGFNTLYNTGDRVRYNKQGDMLFLGRADSQLKIRGLRIEPSEIEYQLQSMSTVSKAVVTDKELDSGEKVLIAFVQLNADERETKVENDSIDACFDHLKNTLPSYMIPNRISVVEHWPLNNNGKIDRQKLRDIHQSTEVNEALVTETENKLASLWSRLLSLPVESLGGTSDFFAIGGNSLLAVRLLSAIQECFSIETNVQIIFSCPKLKDLAAHIEVLMAYQSESINAEDVQSEGWL